MLESLLGMVAILLTVYGIYHWLTLNNDYFKKRGIPYLKPTIAVGNTAPLYFLQCRPNDYFLNLNRQHPGIKIFGMFDFRTPFFFIRDAEVIKQLTVTDFDHFTNRRLLTDNSDDLIWGNSLPFLQGEKWRDMRETLTPEFTGSKIRRMFELITITSTKFIDFLKNAAELSHNGVDVEMSDLFTRLAMDSIASVIFGCEINSFEDKLNDFYTHGNKLAKMSSSKFGLKVIGIKLVPGLFKMLGITLTDSSAANYFTKIIMNNILTRESEGIFRPDFINAVMNLRKQKQQSDVPLKRQWTDKDLISQCLAFIFAGNETSLNLLSFLTYELAVNPNVQERLYREVIEVEKNLNGKPLTYDALQKMKYIDVVVCEAQRRWPATPMVERVCVKDYEYNDGEIKIKFEKGIAFWIPIYSLHHDEAYWKHPNKFDPERFNDQNKNLIPPGAFVPFGIGQRKCIGARFALTEVKIATYLLLLHFKIEPNENTQIPIKVTKQPIGMSPERGVHLRLTMRK